MQRFSNMFRRGSLCIVKDTGAVAFPLAQANCATPSRITKGRVFLGICETVLVWHGPGGPCGGPGGSPGCIPGPQYPGHRSNETPPYLSFTGRAINTRVTRRARFQKATELWHPQTNASIVLTTCRRGMTPALRQTRHLFCHHQKREM